jgi:pimeloyl-ACP methyl ester carboxylesterase/glyoxylase-like metal-dependent hydrolase (beta-lactamase superfamily II)
MSLGASTTKEQTMLSKLFQAIAVLVFLITPAYATDPARTAEDPDLVWTASQVVLVSRQIAPNVYAVFPDDAEVKNKAGIPVATSGGFVIGDDGVLVVESMLNRRLANQMLALVRQKTAKPVLYVVNTSYHGDHSYGNQFMPKSARIVQHAETQKYIQAHFKEDVAFMTQYFGANQGLGELRAQRADVLVSEGDRLEIDLGGKRVQVLSLGFAQTIGDLFVWLPADKVLYAGNPIIAAPPALPWLLDGRIDDAVQTLTKLRALIPDDTVVVPGHGAPVGPKAIDFNIEYLTRLRKEVRTAIDRGLDEKATVQAVSMKEYEGYKIFGWVHRQINVPKTFAEMTPTADGPYSVKSAVVNGVRISYRTAGSGPPVLLLHGYTQTGHMWLPLIPQLAANHTVVVPDLRGFGWSERASKGYDKKTMAVDMHELMRALGHKRATVVGHDIGLMVAYVYAAQFPDEVDRVVLMDAFLPGVGDWTTVWLLRDLWHFHFYGEAPLALVKGRERTYFEHFWNDFAADRTRSVPEADRQFYAAAYARDDGMRAGFEVFKNFEQDARDFSKFSTTKLQMPFLVLSGEKAGGQFLIDQTRLVATNVTGTVIQGSGHWLMEEAPQQVIPAIIAFTRGGVQ